MPSTGQETENKGYGDRCRIDTLKYYNMAAPATAGQLLYGYSNGMPLTVSAVSVPFEANSAGSKWHEVPGEKPIRHFYMEINGSSLHRRQ